MPVTVDGEETTAAVPAATNNAEHYSRSCDATIGLKVEKHNIPNILDLDDVDSVKAHYAYYRWTVIVHLQLKGNFHDSLCEYLDGSKVPDVSDIAFAPDSICTDGLKLHQNIGPPCKATRQMGLTRRDLRMRATSIMLAYLPDCRWRDEVMDFAADRPIYSFFADCDAIYLAADDESRLHAQVDYYLKRWLENESLQNHIRQMAKLSDSYLKITRLASPNFKLTATDKWDQFVISVI